MAFHKALFKLVAVFCVWKFVSSWDMMVLHNLVVGAGCAWDNQSNLTGMAKHECRISCMTNKKCTALNYDIENGVCMRLEKPCPVVHVQPHVHYQIRSTTSANKCVLWVNTHDWNYPRSIKVNQDDDENLLGVTRLTTNAGDILPAKWPNANTYSFTTISGNEHYSSTFEVLFVNEACSLRWIYYDASARTPLPARAIQGGQLSDGTPLYVAVIHASPIKHVVGYYNHAARMGYCEYFGVTAKQELELLTVVWDGKVGM